ncbi:BRO family protein [Rhodoplanes sp. TEM]|uniref:BRO family protein n=1 Tax=Rhodoplanes tepidamans TaxID=200616 RepID=A0ABT5J5A0_RHOTP|nr:MULTISPECIES: BRO family protein [Rhodoplanes]MDC7784830.1 BRO family protein [Rhodoplanes tepidamans]MDC7982297.1 BRO family protein [Rhodoplanes sp. TEM]MDQ0356305.1 prophage antirepressor-like protein [Rhodoplanes tepidamans]
MSRNEVIPFEFENRTIRMVELDGEVWFVASDVARELGYAEAKDLTRTLDADERGRHIVPTPSADQDMSIISEPGLYRAIVQRRATKRIAPDLAERVSRFQRKVFHEVLPAIRKTGEYRAPGKSPARLTRDAAREARLSWKLATSIAASVGLKGNQLLIAANRYTRRVLGIDMLETMGVPLLPAPEPEVLLTATDIGQKLGGLSAQRVNELLERHGFQKSVRDHKGRLHWEPTDKGLKAGGHMVEVERSNKTGEARQLRWASSIVQALREAMLPKPSTDDLPPAQGALL